MICKNCKRDVECEVAEPYCICCMEGKDENPIRGKKCFFQIDCNKRKGDL